MRQHRKERISVTRVAAAFAAAPMSDDHLRALAALTDHEADVLNILTAYRVAMGGAIVLDDAELSPGPRVPPIAAVLRTAGRRRSFRRALARADDETRQAYSAVRLQIDAQYGATKPVDPLAPLCCALYAEGLTPTDIVDLLAATGVEKAGTDACAARKRVDERIRRRISPRLRATPVRP